MALGTHREANLELTIDAAGVAKTYSDGAGLRGLDLQVSPGSVVGLIGPSGAGKTTAVRLLLGLLSRDEGELVVLGSDPEHFDGRTRSQLGYLPQDTALYPTLSVRENLDFVAALHGLRGKRRATACEAVLETVELADVQERRLDKLSGGMRRRAGLAAALVHGPSLMFLDEPTAGQDPVLRRSIWDHLDSLGGEGSTLIVTTQYVGEAVFCDVIVFLAEGEVIAIGDPEQLRRDAFGGELIDVTFEEPPGWEAIETIGKSIEAAQSSLLGYRSVRYIVPDAGSALPRVTEVARERGLEVVETDRVVPEFDEVFVRMVDDHTSRGSGQ